MRLHHAMHVLTRRLRGDIADEATLQLAEATIREALLPFVRRGNPIREMSSDDIVNASIRRLLAVAPDCAAEALPDGPQAKIADSQCGEYLRLTVRSVKADQIRKLQSRDNEKAAPDGDLEAVSPAGPAAPPLDEDFLRDIARNVIDSIIPRLAKAAGPEHADRMTQEGRLAIAEMIGLQTGHTSVAAIVDLDRSDPGFKAARDSMYQRHCRLRGRISATAHRMATMLRSPLRPEYMLTPDEVADIDRWLLLLKRRR